MLLQYEIFMEVVLHSLWVGDLCEASILFSNRLHSCVEFMDWLVGWCFKPRCEIIISFRNRKD